MDTSTCGKATHATSIPNAHAEILIRPAVPQFHNTISFGFPWVFANDWRIEVFNSTIATFRAPSDISSVTGIHHEHIQATPSWRSGPACYDTVLINSNPDVEGIYRFEIAHTLLFFAFWHQERHYPCALVHWFSFVGVEPDEDTGFSTVEPDFTDDGSPCLAIVHIDAIYRAVHLLAAHQNAQFINRAFTMHSTLDKFKLFYVNKYADIMPLILCDERHVLHRYWLNPSNSHWVMYFHI